jgi:hypothetical protein
MKIYNVKSMSGWSGFGKVMDGLSGRGAALLAEAAYQSERI